MAEYIEREAAIEATWEILNGLGYSQKVGDRLVEEVEAAFDDIPAADVAPVRRGRWIPHKEETETDIYANGWLSKGETIMYGYECSECGRWERDKEPFCNCGAKMEDDE